MRGETTITAKLVKALDDSRLFCDSVNASVTRPSLKHLLERIAQTHQRIADELCGRIVAADGAVPRKGRAWWSLRMAWCRRLARSSCDIELAYATQTRQREDHLLRQFRGALQRTCGLDIRDCLVHRLHEIERARAEIDRTVALLEAQSNVSWIDHHARPPIQAVVTVQRPYVQDHGRFEAWPTPRPEQNGGRRS